MRLRRNDVELNLAAGERMGRFRAAAKKDRLDIESVFSEQAEIDAQPKRHLVTRDAAVSSANALLGEADLCRNEPSGDYYSDGKTSIETHRHHLMIMVRQPNGCSALAARLKKAAGVAAPRRMHQVFASSRDR